MKASINIDFDLIAMTDAITVESLKGCLLSLKHDLKKDAPRVFFTDAKKDKREIQRHVDAFELVLGYFTK